LKPWLTAETVDSEAAMARIVLDNIIDCKFFFGLWIQRKCVLILLKVFTKIEETTAEFVE
jgi:hypothetical protein